MARVLRREQLMLPTDLTQDEFNAMARELAETHEALALERERQKAVKAELKEQLEDLEQKRNQLARIVQRRKDDRLVDTEQHANDARGVVECVRMDTGEVYSTRPMTDAERQLDAFGSGAPEAKRTTAPASSLKH